MSTLANFRFPGAMRQTLRQLAFVICPDDLERLGIVDEVVEGTELFCRALAAPVRLGIVAGTTTFDLLAAARPATLGKRFVQLDATDAVAYFDTWWHSGLPLFSAYAKGIKSLLAMAYYEHMAVRAQMNYFPERWIEEAGAQRMQRYGDDIRAHEAILTRPDPLRPKHPGEVNHG